MKIGAFIPARGGSKRIPLKNITPLKGQPLVNWTINALLESDAFDEVAVSTEDDRIIDSIRASYSNKDVIIIRRPQRMAGDIITPGAAFGHYLENKPDIDYGGIFLPTYPFRRTDQLISINNTLRRSHPWMVSSITQKRFCTMDQYYPVKGGVKNVFYNHPAYTTVSNSAYVYWNRDFFLGKMNPGPFWSTGCDFKIPISLKEACDIDTPEDLAYAEKIADSSHLSYRPLTQHAYKNWTLITPQGIDIKKLIQFIGPEKLDDTQTPFLVLKKVKHSYSRNMSPYNFWFSNMSAYSYFYNNGVRDENSQTYPLEFRSSGSYRLLRKDDLSGINSQTFFADINSTVPTYLDSGHRLAPDTVPWQHTLPYEDLSKQDFFINPIQHGSEVPQ